MAKKIEPTQHSDAYIQARREIFTLSKLYKRSEDPMVREFGNQLFTLIEGGKYNDTIFHALTKHLIKFTLALQDYELRRKTKLN